MRIPDPRFLALSTGRVAYRRAGEGPPLLLIHGWGGSSRHWMGAFETLVEHHDVVAIDLPGFGVSPPPRGPAGLGELTGISLETADALGFERFAVSGHSLGAAVAMLVAALCPQRVQRLALVSFGLPRGPQEEAFFAGLHMQMRLSAAVWSPLLSLWEPVFTAIRPFNQLLWMLPPMPVLLAAQVLHQVPAVPYSALAMGAVDMASMSARVAVETASTAGDPAVTAAARQVAVPTLVISGREDQIFPPSASMALSDVLPNSGLVLLDKCGHVPMAECPAPFYTTLGAFLAP